MIGTLGKSNHALLQFDLSSVLPMQNTNDSNEQENGEETKEASMLHRELLTGAEFQTAYAEDGKRGHIIKHKYVKVA